MTRRSASTALLGSRVADGRLTLDKIAIRAVRGYLMAILVDNDTRLVVQGLTGSEGRFHGLRNRAYGTNLVAGVTPGKGGQDVEGVPIFDTVERAVRERGANTSMIFVPAPFAADAMYEAVDAGIDDGDLHHRGCPGPRHAAHPLVHRPARRHADRAELPGRALARARRTSGSSPPRSSPPARSASSRARGR